MLESGPYRIIKIGDAVPQKFYVGTFDLRTSRIIPPGDGRPFLIDDPVLGTVLYDGEGRRVIDDRAPT